MRGVSRNAFGRQLDEADRFELGALILRRKDGDEKALQQLVDSQPGITKIMIQAAALRRAKDLSDGAVTANQFNRRMEDLATLWKSLLITWLVRQKEAQRRRKRR